MTITQQQRQHIVQAARHHGLRLVILHGSQATDNTRPGSDIDIAVLSSSSLSFAQRSDVQAELATALGVSGDSIDLVDIRTTSPLLKHRISRNGNVMFGSAREAERFHLSAITGYIDARRIMQATEEYVRTYGHR